MAQHQAISERWKAAGLAGATIAAGITFFLYQSFRGMSETFGWSTRAFLLAAAVSVVIFLLPLVMALYCTTHEVLMARYRRLVRRCRRGRCLRCAYELGVARLAVCPECGTPVRRPHSPRPFLLRLLATTLIAVIGGGLAGCIAGEAWMLADEARFRREAAEHAAGGRARYSRQRCWPNEGCSLIYDTDGRWPGGPYYATE